MKQQQLKAGMIVYWNNRYKKWYRMNKNFKHGRKLLGIVLNENGDVATHGGFEL
jgi:hypothetical protein